MTVLVDTSVMIDALRGVPDAVSLLRTRRLDGALHASEISKLEVLVGMLPHEERVTRALLDVFSWHPVDDEIAEIAGELGRRWHRKHCGIDGADLAIAATVCALEAELLTRNVKHFPMFEGLAAPY